MFCCKIYWQVICNDKNICTVPGGRRYSYKFTPDVSYYSYTVEYKIE